MGLQNLLLGVSTEELDPVEAVSQKHGNGTALVYVSVAVLDVGEIAEGVIFHGLRLEVGIPLRGVCVPLFLVGHAKVLEKEADWI